MVRKFVALSLSATVVLAGCSSTGVTYTAPAAVPVTSAQVIKHVVVIFGENVSFDHYFGTYPNAKNPAGESQFTAATGTPVPANLTGSLLTANPNSTNAANGAGATNPYRLDVTAAATNDQDHNYGPEQTAFDNGKMDLFPLSVGVPDSAALAQATGSRLHHHHQRPHHGLLRRQHRYGPVELRPALRAQRSRLRQQPSAPPPPVPSTSSPARPTARSPALAQTPPSPRMVAAASQILATLIPPAIICSSTSSNFSP